MVVYAAHPRIGPTMTHPLDRTLSALADPTRREVIDLLRRGPCRASDIAETLHMSRPAMSRHLKILRQAGLVAEDGLEDDARARVYHLQRAPFTELGQWISEVEAFWGEQLQAFKLLAEQVAREETP